jgi:hypothetical protein
VHRPVVKEGEDGAADVAAPNAVSAATASTAHFVPPLTVTASLSCVHLCSFRSITM